MLNVFQTCLKGFKLKKLVVEPKMTQPIESDEEPVDPHLNRSRGAKKILSHFQNSCSIDQGSTSTGQPPPQSVEVQSRGGRGPTVTC